METVRTIPVLVLCGQLSTGFIISRAVRNGARDLSKTGIKVAPGRSLRVK